MPERSPETRLFERVCVIGVGLIGGSLARDLRVRGLAGHIVGCSRKQENLDRALALGVIDEGETSVERAVSGADWSCSPCRWAPCARC